MEHEICTFESLDQLDPLSLKRVTQRVVGTLGVSRLWLGRCLMALDRNDKAFVLGYSGAIHFAIIHGVEHRVAVEARRVARCLESLPLLRAEAEAGTIVWASLREIVSKAVPETEAAWIDLATRLTTSKIARLVSQTRKGEMPGVGEKDVQEPRATQVWAKFEGVELLILEESMRDLSEEEGRSVTFAEYVIATSVSRLARRLHPDEKAVAKVYDKAEKDLQAEAAPWAAVAVNEAPAPEDPEVSLARPARVPHWSNTRLEFNAESRNLTSGQRTEILRRDGYRCSTPDCPHNLWLQVHHIVFYCRGGATVPDNLALCCSRCHRNIHDGYLRVKGRAPTGLNWTTTTGSFGAANPARGFGHLVGEVSDEDG